MSRSTATIAREARVLTPSSEEAPQARLEGRSRRPRALEPILRDARSARSHDEASPERLVKLVLVVAAALIDADGRVLLAQRPKGKPLEGLWEFPAARSTPAKRPEEALIRELGEELGITVKADCLAPLTFASHAYDDFHLLMPLYVCRRWEGFVPPLDGQALKWVRREGFARLSDAARRRAADPASGGVAG